MSNKTNLYINCEKCNDKIIRTGHRQKYCLRCAKIMCKVHTKQWCEKKKENLDGWKKQQRKYHVKALYGITLEQWQQMYDKQNGLCAICGQPEVNRNLGVDHRHSDGKVRSLLCCKCNLLVGIIETEFWGLKDKVIDYLARHDD